MSAFYLDSFGNHFLTSNDQIIGTITTSYSEYYNDQKKQQTETWKDTILIIKDLYRNLSLFGLDVTQWGILYEYRIPRRSKRIDVVILAENLIFVLEIKNHHTKYDLSSKVQLEDYCLDLRDFHHESRNRVIVPILICTDATEAANSFSEIDDPVKNVLLSNKDGLSEIINKAFNSYKNSQPLLILNTWNQSSYSPTPTIIEAAQVLYSRHSVEEIVRNEAGINNLSKTTSSVLQIIKDAQKSQSKVICFISGVPGAGKTLAGLNIIHKREFSVGNEETIGAFVSGNSPLVKVLSEALIKNSVKQEKVKENEAKRKVKTFIQNVHEFIDEYYTKKEKPKDHILIYDEAQRAWTREHKKKKSNGKITESEPEILLSIMNRHSDWAVIIALIGGGQEINTGEGGLREWGNSLETTHSHWKINVSPELKEGDHSTGDIMLFTKMPSNIQLHEDSNLHLRVSIRSYKAQQFSKWISLLLDNKNVEAKTLLEQEILHYPIVLTRDIELAKSWLKKKSRGTRRIGIVASSGGRRLRAFGYDPYHGLRGNSDQKELGAWYLNSSDDVRSSNFLEIVATEYAVQGLEIDWVGLLWDADFYRNSNKWDYKQFRGTKWQTVSNEQKKQYIKNKYRVLLTRAREGLIIVIPHGDASDMSRSPEFYDETFEYLKSCGIKVI